MRTRRGLRVRTVLIGRILLHGLGLLVEYPHACNNRVEDGLGLDGAPRYVGIDRDDGIHATPDVVAGLVDAASAGACAAGDDDLGLEHLVVYLLDDRGVLVVNPTGDDEDVGMLGVSRVDDAKALGVIERRQRGEDLDVAAVAAGPVVMDDPG